MIIDTNELKQKVRDYYAKKVEEVDSNERITDKTANRRLTKIENSEFNDIKLIDDIKRLQKSFDNV